MLGEHRWCRSPLAGRCPFHPADLAVYQRQAANRVLKEFARGLVWLFFSFLLGFFLFCFVFSFFPWFNVQGLQGLFCQPSFVMAPGTCLL